MNTKLYNELVDLVAEKTRYADQAIEFANIIEPFIDANFTPKSEVGVQPEVMPKIAEMIDTMVSDYEEIINGYGSGYGSLTVYGRDIRDCEERIIALKEVKERLSNFTV